MLSQAEIDALLSGAIEIEEPNSQNRVNLAELMGQAPAPPSAMAGESRYNLTTSGLQTGFQKIKSGQSK